MAAATTATTAATHDPSHNVSPYYREPLPEPQLSVNFPQKRRHLFRNGQLTAHSEILEQLVSLLGLSGFYPSSIPFVALSLSFLHSRFWYCKAHFSSVRFFIGTEAFIGECDLTSFSSFKYSLRIRRDRYFSWLLRLH
jgi:hypothetical protein